MTNFQNFPERLEYISRNFLPEISELTTLVRTVLQTLCCLVVSVFVCACVHSESFWTRCLVNELGKFPRIYKIGVFEDKNEHIRFWDDAQTKYCRGLCVDECPASSELRLVQGLQSSLWFLICWPHSPTLAMHYLCRFARHMWMRCSRVGTWYGRLKPGCHRVGSVTVVCTRRWIFYRNFFYRHRRGNEQLAILAD